MIAGEIPISDAADICKRRGCAYVIVFGVREHGDRFHVTTYGMTKKLCKVAGAIGDQFAEAVLKGNVVPPDTEPRINAELLEACKVAAQCILADDYDPEAQNRVASQLLAVIGRAEELRKRTV
jgi:hypothetical protein